MSVWQLRGTPQQNQIIQEALDKCDFPFDRLIDGLRRQTGRVTIPVEWADLSREAESDDAAGARQHVHDGDAVAHPIVDPESRSATLGLAWTNGRIQMEQSLVNNPRLAQEVFLAEGAHMVDFFYMTDADRAAVDDAMHGGPDAGHGHDWFDVGGYETWVGEGFMGQFIASFAPTVGVTLTQFVHRPTVASNEAVRKLLLRTPEPTPTPPPVNPIAAFPFAAMDRWAGAKKIWWPKRDRVAAEAYAAWRKTVK